MIKRLTERRVFFDADGAGGGGGPQVPPVVTPPADPAAPASPNSNPPAVPQDVAKYTDKQLNDLVAKNAAKEAARILKDAGIEPTGDLKKDVEAFKAWKQSTMTETERLKAQLEERDTADAETKKTTDAIRAENAALRNGVPADKVDRVVKLSAGYEGETPDERVAAVLAEFPEFKAGPGDIGGPVKDQRINDNDAMMGKLREMRKR